MSLNPIVKPPFEAAAQLIRGETAFYNPIAQAIDLAIAKSEALLIDLPNIANPLHPSYLPTVAPYASEILAGADNLITNMGTLLGHSDRLSGVVLIPGMANFATISSVVATVQRYGNDGSACELVNAAFGTIVNASKFVNQITVLLGRLNNLINSPATIINDINNLISAVEAQIEADLFAFAQASITALQYAAAAAIGELINNPCIGEIIGIVGSAELKKVVLPKVRDII